MQRTIKLAILISALLVIFGSTVGIAGNPADSVKDITPSLALNYLYNSNDTVILTATISVRRESGFFGLENAEIEFLAGADQAGGIIGKVKTDYEGIATFRYPLKKGFPADKNGNTTYSARFAGKGHYLAAASDAVTAHLAKLTVNFSTQDSARYININGVDLGISGNTTPLAKTKVIILVPRLFSLLKIGEIELDELGAGRIDYPANLVGDSLGRINVIARIEENDKYANVQGQQTINWAISKYFYKAEQPTRELWTPVAPIWMIVTLIIMLTGVWAHYIYAIIQLVYIKRLSKTKKEYL